MKFPSGGEREGGIRQKEWAWINQRTHVHTWLIHVMYGKKKNQKTHNIVNSLQLEVLVLLILCIFFQTPLVILQKLYREGGVWAEGTVASYPSLYSNDHTSGMPKAVLFHTYYLLY